MWKLEGERGYGKKAVLVALEVIFISAVASGRAEGKVHEQPQEHKGGRGDKKGGDEGVAEVIQMLHCSRQKAASTNSCQRARARAERTGVHADAAEGLRVCIAVVEGMDELVQRTRVQHAMGHVEVEVSNGKT